MFRRIFFIAAVACTTGLVFAATQSAVLLPDGWRLTPAHSSVAKVGTMPQGIALSPDGNTVAVVESGVNKPALRLLDPKSLAEQKTIALEGAFGAPVWLDATHVLVPGANTDALLDVNTADGSIASIPDGAHRWPVAVALAPDKTHVAISNDGDGTITLGTLPDMSDAATVSVGAHPGGAVFSQDGKTLYVTVREPSTIAVIDVASHSVTNTIHVGSHPNALAFSADGARLYVTEDDDDAIGVIDPQTNTRVAEISVQLHARRLNGYGASPNALLVHGNDLFVSLGGENAIARIRGGKVVERIPAGWYPTGLAIANDGTLLVSNGKGENAPPNPQFNPLKRRSPGYVASITVGSVRTIPAPEYAHAGDETAQVIADAVPQWTPAPAAQTVLRPNGPIRHVIYVIKENRSYDQVLGDVPGANGDPQLTLFGKNITPNQHMLAERFGIFDNAYANSQVSADGHNWTDAAIANDYVERYWPPNYGGRRELYDFQNGQGADVPHSGYLWDAAKRAHITYRDYGEDTVETKIGHLNVTDHPGLQGHFDARYVGWDLGYPERARYAEWQREFRQFVANGDMPQLEIVYFPNDHTSGTAPGKPTPQAYVASNDWAVGKLVETVSHSRYWRSTAIFVLEDDAQNGPDHVSDQRSTFYIASPYARGGVRHEHYSTISVLHSMELLLGLQPLSIYDATARPLYDAFTTSAKNAAPFNSVEPRVDMQAVNAQTAYGSAISAKLNFKEPDAVNPRVLNDILAHAAGVR